MRTHMTKGQVREDDLFFWVGKGPCASLFRAHMCFHLVYSARIKWELCLLCYHLSL